MQAAASNVGDSLKGFGAVKKTAGFAIGFAENASSAKQLGGASLAEAKALMRRWDAASFRNVRLVSVIMQMNMEKVTY